MISNALFLSGDSAMNAVVVKMGDHVIECTKPPDCNASHDESESMWKHGHPRNTPSWFWRNGGCVTNLGGDLKLCRVYSGTHLQVFGTTSNTQYHGNGPQVIARTNDDSVRIDGFNPLYSGESAMNAVVVKMSDHVIDQHVQDRRLASCCHYACCAGNFSFRGG